MTADEAWQPPITPETFRGWGFASKSAISRHICVERNVK